MKRDSVIIGFAVMAIMALLLSFASCTKKPAETADPATEHAEPTTLDVPTDAEVAAAYEKAREAYNWFDMTTMPLSEETVDVEAMTYNKVNYPGVTTMAELEAYLKTLFTDDVVNELLALNKANKYWHYDDIDGALYALPADRGGDILKGKESYEVIVNGGAEIVYRVSVEVYDDPTTMNVVDTEVHDYKYVDTTGSGDWRFSNFDSVR